MNISDLRWLSYSPSMSESLPSIVIDCVFCILTKTTEYEKATYESSCSSFSSIAVHHYNISFILYLNYNLINYSLETASCTCKLQTECAVEESGGLPKQSSQLCSQTYWSHTSSRSYWILYNSSNVFIGGISLSIWSLRLLILHLWCYFCSKLLSHWQERTSQESCGWHRWCPNHIFHLKIAFYFHLLFF